jgi:transketolase
MRKAFFDTLVSEARNNQDLMFITADLGFGFIEEYVKKFPQQFLNVGVSEQAMLGLANGLATSGKKVICYSIASFSLIRPFEFFRNGAIAHNQPVMVVGVGPGFDYSHDGITHYCLEDLAIIQSQPGVAIKTPFTANAVGESLRDFIANPQPTYLRLPRAQVDFDCVDLAKTVEEEIEVLIICTALMGERATVISNLVEKEGLSTKVGSVNELSSEVDRVLIKHLVSAKKCVVIEDHYEFGGLGSRIGDLILKNNLSTKLIKDGVVSIPRGTIGSHKFMASKIMKSTKEVLKLIIK